MARKRCDPYKQFLVQAAANRRLVSNFESRGHHDDGGHTCGDGKGHGRSQATAAAAALAVAVTRGQDRSGDGSHRDGGGGGSAGARDNQRIKSYNRELRRSRPVSRLPVVARAYN